MKTASGMANAAQIAVTASAMPSVRIEVEKYAGTVTILAKFSSVNPGFTRDVNGSVSQNAVMSSRASDSR